jgi:hypothetical protein
MKALLRATATGDALCAIDAMAIFVEYMGVMGADHRAIAALDALVGEKRQLRLRLAAFWIVAPTTPQRTALQKNCRPDARPVMNRKTFDIDQFAIRCHVLSCFMKIYHAFSL